jgi:hypothetical protein
MPPDHDLRSKICDYANCQDRREGEGQPLHCEIVSALLGVRRMIANSPPNEALLVGYEAVVEDYVTASYGACIQPKEVEQIGGQIKTQIKQARSSRP